MNGLKEKFGLATAISMVVGIVIGSGVFFKADDVLIATNGNLPLAILAWVCSISLLISRKIVSVSNAGMLVAILKMSPIIILLDNISLFYWLKYAWKIAVASPGVTELSLLKSPIGYN